MRETEFVFLLLPDLGSPLRQFRFEARPCASGARWSCLLLEQAECFFGGKLCDAGEVTDAETVENLSAAEFALRHEHKGHSIFSDADGDRVEHASSSAAKWGGVETAGEEW